MQTSVVPRFAFPILLCFAVACDAQQPTSPASRGAQSQGSFSSSRGRDASNTTIVLVHGAWADGTGWQEIIPLLQKEGYKVVAVQNPLTTLAADVETTKRAIDGETAKGRAVVVVGHSYGGAVMSGAAAGNNGVKALVYIAAFAPDAGEPLGAFLERYPTELPTAFVPDAAGFVYLSADKYRSIFAGDLPEKQTRVMAVSQKPAHGAIFGQSNPAAAWRASITKVYVVAQEDKTLNPDLERFYAQRMGAQTIEIKASHLVFISRPKQVAEIILAATPQ